MRPEYDQKIKSYLVFTLGEEDFAVHVSKVLNILEMVRVTKVPNTPAYMRGVINLRGTVLPVIDTRLKFNLPIIDDNKNTCIIVLDLIVEKQELKMGIIVDAVKEVLEIDSEKILNPPSIGSEFRSEFIYGMVEIEDHFIMLLDIDGIFSAKEVINLKSLSGDISEKKIEEVKEEKKD